MAARLLLGERYTWVDGLSACVAFTGVLLVAQPAALFGADSPPMAMDGILAAFASAMFGALSYVQIRQLSGKVSAILVTWAFSLTGALFAPLCALVVSGWVPPSELGLLAALGVCGWAGQYLLTFGVQNAPTSVSTVMRYSDVLLSLIAQSFILGKPPGTLKIVGCLMIVSCVTIALQRSRYAKPVAVVVVEEEAVTVVGGGDESKV